MMTTRITLGLCSAFLAVSALTATEQPAEQPMKYKLTGATMDGPNLAYAMMRTFMTEEEWQKRVAKCKSRYETWNADNGGDMGQFLNDRLIIVALGAAGGDIEKIQNGIAYLALYREFRQVPPGRVMKFLREHKESVTELLDGFTWQAASEYVKDKKWREDIARRKARAEQKKAAEEAKANKVEPVEVATAEPASTQAESQPAVQHTPKSTLKTMSLDWEAISTPLTAETP